MDGPYRDVRPARNPGAFVHAPLPHAGGLAGATGRSTLPPMARPFDGRRVPIPGASNGIARATALAFARAGRP